MSGPRTSSTGRWGIQQFARVRGQEVWTFATIGCGYDDLADAQKDASRQQGCRVADRFTGEPHDSTTTTPTHQGDLT